MHAVVVGCGRVGRRWPASSPTRLVRGASIDEAVEAFNRLDPAFPGETFEGHALDDEVLRLAGIERADACVVATNGDNTNLVVAQKVQRKFGVRVRRRARPRPGPRRAVRAGSGCARCVRPRARSTC